MNKEVRITIIGASEELKKDSNIYLFNQQLLIKYVSTYNDTFNEIIFNRDEFTIVTDFELIGGGSILDYVKWSKNYLRKQKLKRLI